MAMDRLFQLMADKKASDIFLSVGSPINIKISGVTVPINQQIMDNAGVQSLLAELLNERQMQQFEDTCELNIGYPVSGVGSFRISAFKQRGSTAVVIRYIPYDIPALETLNLPPVLSDLVMEKRGLILMVGATGTGKSTTMAAMLEWRNQNVSGHILTIEDPIEYIHQHKGCLVNQREVHSDTQSFSNALRAALREDPDIVLIGEMRDLETVEAALRIAETGHLTFATLHTNSAAQTINRIIDIFPSHQQSQIRTQLSLVLEGIVCQALMPRTTGGRVCSMEIMIPTPAIRNLIREDKVHQIYSAMQTGQEKLGMQTQNQSLATLYLKKLISLDTALGASSNREELQEMINRGVGVVAGAGLRRPGGATPAVIGR